MQREERKNGKDQWICQQILNGNLDSIYCLLLISDDNLIIFGSWDEKIKLWIKQDQWSCQYTLTEHTNPVVLDSQILVIQQSQTQQKWGIMQKINFDQFRYRICIINDDCFTFQPTCEEYMHVYKMEYVSKQYIKTMAIAVNSGSNSCKTFYPQQYSKQKSLLVNKNGNNINLIMNLENGKFIIEQSIEFVESGQMKA